MSRDHGVAAVEHISDEINEYITSVNHDLGWLLHQVKPADILFKNKIHSISNTLNVIHKLVNEATYTDRVELNNGNDSDLSALVKREMERFEKVTGIRCGIQIDPAEDNYEQLSHANIETILRIFMRLVRTQSATRAHFSISAYDGKYYLSFEYRRSDRQNKYNIVRSLYYQEKIGIFVQSIGGVIEWNEDKHDLQKLSITVPLQLKSNNADIRVMLADSHPIFREGLKNILKCAHDIVIKDEVYSKELLFKKITVTEANVIILDYELIRPGLMNVVQDLKSRRPDIFIFVFGALPEEQYAIRFIRAGASAYLSKYCTDTEIIKALRVISRGRTYITSNVAEKLANEINKHSEKLPHEKLSDREYEVFRYLASGKSISEIAKEIFLSAKTISTYRRRIMEKMAMNNNTELTLYCVDNQLIE